MYDNIGGKIKAFTVAVAVIMAMICIISGIVLMATGNGLVGLLTAVIGSFSAWISSWLLYGFGELIEQTSRTAYYMDKLAIVREEVRTIRKMLDDAKEQPVVQASNEHVRSEEKVEVVPTVEQVENLQKQEQPVAKVKVSDLSYLKVDNEVEKKVYPPNTMYENGWWKCGNCGTENAPYCNSCSCGNTKKQISTK